MIASFVAIALWASVASAQTYPSKPIRLVLGVGTGGVGDVTMRLVAQQMSKSMGQSIVVENRPSAGGVAAAVAVVNANPDGYTVLQTGNAAAISVSLFKKLPFDMQKDFTQVSTTGIFQLALVATPDAGLTTMPELIVDRHKRARAHAARDRRAPFQGGQRRHGRQRGPAAAARHGHRGARQHP